MPFVYDPHSLFSLLCPPPLLYMLVSHLLMGPPSTTLFCSTSHCGLDLGIQLRPPRCFFLSIIHLRATQLKPLHYLNVLPSRRALLRLPMPLPQACHRPLHSLWAARPYGSREDRTRGLCLRFTQQPSFWICLRFSARTLNLRKWERALDVVPTALRTVAAIRPSTRIPKPLSLASRLLEIMDEARYRWHSVL